MDLTDVCHKDPFRVADMAIEIQVEKMKLAEAASARDSAIQRLSSAYDAIKEKAVTIAHLQSEKADLERRIAESEVWMSRAVEDARAEERRALEVEIGALKELIKRLNDEIRSLKGDEGSGKLESPSETTLVASPSDNHLIANSSRDESVQRDRVRSLTKEFENLSVTSRSQSRNDFNAIDHGSPFSSKSSQHHSPLSNISNCSSDEPVEMDKARFQLLASLPVPSTVPDDVLKPIIIPAPFTIHEFLGNTSGVSRRLSLYGYRVFHDQITRWCPNNEEHGYFLTPLYKCTTNPKVPTAHRWSEVDPKGRMHKPTECFYNKEGKWYYAGQYIAMRLADLNVKEWDALDAETSQMLVKETLAGRKNTAAQNHFEVSQLYACGALKVACIGLQCVGFNTSLYRTIMEQASRCQQNGRWRSGWSDSDPLIGSSDSTTSLSSALFG
ncbi:hypothetical protein SCHPADRAFT_817820 [Schizopora paradoxa]|uniref:DUF6697 domain-containing protein n=1 Tax=Schizopora paradoxa TaxID=27342 RepID=A0A0H2SCY8_9AGAM|nr:hypothetical protein SCHPADRAFT_817820 [Schizopora paradoxa]